MFTHIRMKNFKSWKDSGEVKLAPLTGLFGTNSSGKSSLLQMLLLLKQTIGTEDILFFGDENSLVNLGNFREVIHGHKEEALLQLEFGCKVQKPFTIPLRDQFNNYTGHSLNVESFTFNAPVSCRENRISVTNADYRVKPENENQTVKDDSTTSVIRPSHLNSRRNEGEVIQGNFSEKIYGRPYDSRARNAPILQFSSEFKRLFSHIYYLGPTRVDPRRHYSWNGSHPEHIRQWGNQTIAALLSARVRKLKTLHKAEELPIEEKVSYWLQEMELAYSFSLDWVSEGATTYEVRLQKSPESAPVTLVDMGYGLEQFLPVLVLCYYAPEGSTLILEQPGIYLHPKVQSQLADLLIEVITERNLQILIESHSEHLLTRLQRRIAEEKITTDQTASYFCRNDEGVSTIERLKMDESGNIKNWPENFFGEVMSDMFAMTDAQAERMAKQDTED